MKSSDATRKYAWSADERVTVERFEMHAEAYHHTVFLLLLEAWKLLRKVLGRCSGAGEHSVYAFGPEA